MRTIKLMPDYRCFPLWNVSPGDYVNISPESLPISNRLQDDLTGWANEYDLTLDLSNPADAGFDTQESADNFVQIGHNLVERLRAELGLNYKVTYIIKAYPKSTAFYLS
jgi:hypothetical protein